MAPVSFFATARKLSGRNGKRSASPDYPERRPQTQNKKENQIMKNRKNILTYIVAAFAILVTSASSSLGMPPLQPPQNYTGRLTHGEFVSCEGQILNPPAYSVGGTWVLNIDMMTQPQVPPPAHLTMVVFRDGSNYLVFPQIALMPVSLQTASTRTRGERRWRRRSIRI